MPTDTKTSEPHTPPKGNSTISKVAERIDSAENVLVALSNNPSVDEMSAAIGLALLLNQLGKHATAIYSGATPNALEFLQPENTFESNTDSLQDFIIALNKEKADHLRYKIDGEFVKVYITPYRTKITDADLEFSHGDYNVDLIIALNVKSGDDLDVALAEYRRILHDATAVNITTEAAGRFAEVEWSDGASSSISEMVVQLADQLGVDTLEQNVATALLTGIIAATDRFSNERTQPSTMSVASQLMAAGADQQLISANIEKTGFTAAPEPEIELTPVDDTLEPDTEIDLKPKTASPTVPADAPIAEPSVSDAKPPVLQPLSPVAPVEPDPTVAGPAPADPTLAEPTVTEPTVTEPAPIEPTPVGPAPIEPTPAELAPVVAPASNPATLAAPPLDAIPEPTALPSLQYSTPVEPVPAPEPVDPDAPKDYAKMMEEELAQPLPIDLERMQQAQAAQAQPVAPSQPANDTQVASSPLDNVAPVDPLTPEAAPTQPLEEAIQPIAPLPADAQLPPPPAPPVNLDAAGLPLPPNAEELTPVPPTDPGSTVAGPTPAEPLSADSTSVTPATPNPAPTTPDPGAFQIPTIS